MKISIGKIFLLVVSCICFSIQAQTLPAGFKKSLGKATLSVLNDTIIASTGKIERKWKWYDSGLLTTSIKDLTMNKEWAGANTRINCDWDLPGAIQPDSKATFVSFDVRESDDDGFSVSISK